MQPLASLQFNYVVILKVDEDALPKIEIRKIEIDIRVEIRLCCDWLDQTSNYEDAHFWLMLEIEILPGDGRIVERGCFCSERCVRLTLFRISKN